MVRISSIFAIIIIVAIAFWSSADIQGGITDVARSVSNYISGHEIAGASAFIVFAALSAVLSPFSSIPTIPFAVLVWGQALTTVFLLTGWFIGAVCSYYIGYHGLHDIYKKIFSIKKVEKYRNKFSEHSEFILIVLFRAALPSEVAGLVLGSVRYNFHKYLLATIITEIPFAIISVYASEALVYSDPTQLLLWALGGVTMLIIASITLSKKIGK